MKIYSWSENYSVNDDKLDNQHKKLFNHIEKLITIYNNSENIVEFFDTLHLLLNNSIFHFDDEIQHYKQYNIDDAIISNHGKKHEFFIYKLSSLINDPHICSKPYMRTIIYFVTLWFIEHILNEDMAIMKEISPSPKLLSKQELVDLLNSNN